MRNNREHRLQAFADRFIDRVVLPPMFTSGIDHASQSTDNARARARGRGIKFGLADCFVVQMQIYGNGSKVMFIEYKRGSKPSGNQEAVAKALAACNIPTAFCTTIRDVWLALLDHGFQLHGNALNISREIEERLDAADRAAEVKKPARSGPPRVRTSARKAQAWGVQRRATLP